MLFRDVSWSLGGVVSLQALGQLMLGWVSDSSHQMSCPTLPRVSQSEQKAKLNENKPVASSAGPPDQHVWVACLQAWFDLQNISPSIGASF